MEQDRSHNTKKILLHRIVNINSSFPMQLCLIVYNVPYYMHYTFLMCMLLKKVQKSCKIVGVCHRLIIMKSMVIVGKDLERILVVGDVNFVLYPSRVILRHIYYPLGELSRFSHLFVFSHLWLCCYVIICSISDRSWCINSRCRSAGCWLVSLTSYICPRSITTR